MIINRNQIRFAKPEHDPDGEYIINFYFDDPTHTQVVSCGFGETGRTKQEELLREISQWSNFIKV